MNKHRSARTFGPRSKPMRVFTVLGAGTILASSLAVVTSPALDVAHLGARTAHASPGSSQAPAASTQPSLPSTKGHRVIADLKRPMEHLPSRPANQRLTKENAEAVLTGLKENLKVNAIRVPIMKSPPSGCGPSEPGKRGMPLECYGEDYDAVIEAAMAKGILIYGSPMETGKQLPDKLRNKEEYIRWITSWQRHADADFLSPFNENGVFTEAEKVAMTKEIKKRLASTNHRAVMVGPDIARIDDSIGQFKGPQGEALQGVFDIDSSHGGTMFIEELPPSEARPLWPDRDRWNALGAEVEDPLWATEIHGDWSRIEGGREIGVKATCGAKDPRGLVLYLAFPNFIQPTGELTPKGQEIANHLVKAKGSNHTRCVL